MAGLTFTFDLGHRPASRREDIPLRILIMGSFRGTGQPAGELTGRRPQAVDIDNLDEVLARLAPKLELPAGDEGAEQTVEFTELEDFHPDALYRKLAVFQPLREIRRRLLDPATSAQAIAELQQQLPGTAAPADVPTREDNTDTLERLLGRRAAATGPDAVAERWIKNLIGDSRAPPAADPQPYLQAIDAALGERLRAMLHDPAFQALEVAWRGVHDLVANLETGEDLQLYLLDVTFEELAADIRAANGDPVQCALYRLLAGQRAPDEPPWSLLAGNYDFGIEQTDLLEVLGTIASRAGGAFLAAAKAEVLGCRSLVQTPDPADWQPLPAEAEQRWQSLRQSRAASWLGLALPRILLRLPYGEQTDPVEEFPFEELPGGYDHQALLWGNPALACARLFAAAHLDATADVLTLEDLPAYTYQDSGEVRLAPCAEVGLGERAAQAILARGIMPWLSHRRRNAIRLARWQSLAV